MLNVPRKILITGATSGIGLALLKRLHAEGHSLVAVARNQSSLSQLQATYDRVSTYPCELASRNQIEALSRTVAMEHPDLGVVINNAGIQYTPTVLDKTFSFDSIEHETTVNFLAPVWLSTLLMPLLLGQQQQCAIVNISSGLALSPKTSSAVYCATKAAIHSFSQALGYQLEGTTVHSIEAILPLVDTPMTKDRGTEKLAPDYVASRIVEGIKATKTEIYIGKTRFLPILMRLSPSLVKRIMKKY